MLLTLGQMVYKRLYLKTVNVTILLPFGQMVYKDYIWKQWMAMFWLCITYLAPVRLKPGLASKDPLPEFCFRDKLLLDKSWCFDIYKVIFVNIVKVMFVNIVKVIFVNIVKVIFVNIVWMRMFWLGAACTCQDRPPWICLPPHTFTKKLLLNPIFFLIFSTVGFQLQKASNAIFRYILLQYFKEKLLAVCACQPFLQIVEFCLLATSFHPLIISTATLRNI